MNAIYRCKKLEREFGMSLPKHVTALYRWSHRRGWVGVVTLKNKLPKWFASRLADNFSTIEMLTRVYL